MSFATTSTETLQQLLADASSHCVECQRPAEHTDAEGFCGGCLDARTCPDCAEHFDAARGPCPCVVERSELADARRDDDRAAFDASVVIVETALAFVPLHAEAAEHRDECACVVCTHHAVAGAL